MAKKVSAEPDMDDYRAESDHGTLMRGQEIQNDPQRMKGVKRFHKKQTRQLGTVGKMLGGKR